MNKGIGSKQPQLRNWWYDLNRLWTLQSMSFQDKGRKWVHKGVQHMLEDCQL